MGPDAPPYADKILLSPHIYPASVIPRGCTGKGLCNRLSNSWGHLSVKVTCKRAPHLQPLQITKGGPALRQWQHHLIITTGLIKPCSAHHISCKGAVNSAGLLQRRTLPALSGAGWGDWQPAAGLPQPLQQSGASVHGVRTAGRLSAIKQRGELESRSTCVSGSNSPHWPQPSTAAAGKHMIWVQPRQFNLKELLHIASAGHIERAYLLTSIVQLLAYGQACCESSSLASVSVHLQTMEDLAHYLVTDDFWHAAVAGWMWWAWNPNSIDTGGIVSPMWEACCMDRACTMFILLHSVYGYLSSAAAGCSSCSCGAHAKDLCRIGAHHAKFVM